MVIKILVDRSTIVQATTAVENMSRLPSEKPDDWNFPTFFTNARLERSWHKARRHDWIEGEKLALSQIAEKVAARSVKLYSSVELQAERMRIEKVASQRRRNVFDDLRIEEARVPFNKSKLPLSMDDFLSKASLINFCKTFLLRSSAEETEAFISRMSKNLVYGPDEFEIHCLRNKAKFQSLCTNLHEGHIPDAFHLWTAEENGMNYFLTLDKKFINAVSRNLDGFACRPAIPSQIDLS